LGMKTPLLYILLFRQCLQKTRRPAMCTAEVLDLFVPGILVLLAFGSGMGAGWLIVSDVNNGIIERLRVTPASRFAMLLGGVLKDVVVFIVDASIVFGMSSRFVCGIAFLVVWL